MKAKTDSWKNYPIELKKLDELEGSGWIARIPSLGRKLFKGYGDTPDEAISQLEEISSEILSEYESSQVEMPEPPTERDEFSGKLGLRLPCHLHARLVQEAEQENVSLNTYIISILSDSFRAPRAKRILDEIQQRINSTERAYTMEVNPSNQSARVVLSHIQAEHPLWSVYGMERSVAK